MADYQNLRDQDIDVLKFADGMVLPSRDNKVAYIFFNRPAGEKL